jgi:hypothetical protein
MNKEGRRRVNLISAQEHCKPWIANVTLPAGGRLEAAEVFLFPMS